MLRSLFSRIFPSSRKETRLRHLLHLGSVMERQAEVFYRRFAEQAQDDEVNELCQILADEETNHFKLIRDILTNWKPLPVKSSDLEALDADGRLRSMFSTPLSQDASKEEIIGYAMDQEIKMVEFYRGFEEEFTNQWKLAKLWGMIEEEVSHVRRLQDMLSRT